MCPPTLSVYTGWPGLLGKKYNFNKQDFIRSAFGVQHSKHESAKFVNADECFYRGSKKWHSVLSSNVAHMQVLVRRLSVGLNLLLSQLPRKLARKYSSIWQWDCATKSGRTVTVMTSNSQNHWPLQHKASSECQIAHCAHSNPPPSHSILTDTGLQTVCFCKHA